MPNVNSVPATFTLTFASPTQAVTFAIPTGFVCSSAVLALVATVVAVGGVQPRFTWTTSTEVDEYVGSVAGGVYNGTVNVSAGGIADINAAAGGNVNGTQGFDSVSGGLVWNVTSLVLQLTGAVPGAVVDRRPNNYRVGSRSPRNG